MFRVPANPDAPTYDQTFKVGFWRWLTSKKTDRKEWKRRMNAAIEVKKARLREREATLRASRNGPAA